MNVYAITEESPDADKDWFSHIIKTEYDCTSDNDIKMVIEDLNTKLGWEDTYQEVTGKHN